MRSLSNCLASGIYLSQRIFFGIAFEGWRTFVTFSTFKLSVDKPPLSWTL
ncbi:hypothetical protein MARINOS108_10994 [Marinoscillum sp. 108]|nr:hypothetical protein MARINOS108_10994 [Marinoscillum sp. 108]